MPAFSFKRAIKMLPGDAMIITGMAAGVYVYGVYTLQSKMRSREVNYLPESRKRIREGLESKFNGSSSL